jgi:hypothetical protein
MPSGCLLLQDGRLSTPAPVLATPVDPGAVLSPVIVTSVRLDDWLRARSRIFRTTLVSRERPVQWSVPMGWQGRRLPGPVAVLLSVCGHPFCPVETKPGPNGDSHQENDPDEVGQALALAGPVPEKTEQCVHSSTPEESSLWRIAPIQKANGYTMGPNSDKANQLTNAGRSIRSRPVCSRPAYQPARLLRDSRQARNLIAQVGVYPRNARKRARRGSTGATDHTYPPCTWLQTAGGFDR